MDLQQRTLRIGLTVILWAAVLRLCTPAPSVHSGKNTPPAAETVPASLSTEPADETPALANGFSPDFAESPIPAPEETGIPCFSGGDLPAVFYGSQVRPALDALLQQPLTWQLTEDEPSVLILHTHTTESYTKTGETYPETADYRTLEEHYNMLSIGAQVARLLAQQGIRVIHDRTIHDYPSYNGSYTHARKTIQSYLTRYPGIRLILDLHRDAADDSGRQLRTLAETNGSPCAQLMVVIGTGHKLYQENLSLGLKLHAQLEQQSPGITRPLQLRSQRFNQDLLPGALLVEVGAAGNSHQEALAAARQLAMAVIALSGGTGVHPDGGQ